jgi:phenylalanyl-tRNA synthetase alpha chain
MDANVLQNEAESAIAGAATFSELDDARVRYLGRKSVLKQALREVRDRETGMTLNAVRERLESAVAARESALERAELDRALAEEIIDVTLPGEAPPRGHLHLITQIRREIEDVFLGLGYEVVDGREVETTHYNFEGLNFPP